MDVLNVLNSALWVIGNIVLVYTSVALLVYLIAYYIFFDPRATTGGKLIFQFMLSLVGVMALVFIGVYIDPSTEHEWFVLSPEVDWWRPTLRLIIYGFVGYSVTTLGWLLIMRKWFPHRLKKASDMILVEPRHTNEIPIVKPHKESSDF